MPSTSLRKNRRRKRRRNTKSQKRNRSRQRLKLSNRREKSQKPKLPLSDKRNPPRHRPKNRKRKSGIGSDENPANRNNFRTGCASSPTTRGPRDLADGQLLACFGSRPPYQG